MLGHLDRDSTVRLALPDGTATTNIIPKSFQEEYDADLVAAAVLAVGFSKQLETDDHAAAVQIQVTVAGPLFFSRWTKLFSTVCRP